MHGITRLGIVVLVCVLAGCSDPSTSPPLIRSRNNSGPSDISHTSLLGFWDCAINPGIPEVEITPNRTAMFTVNVVNFLNMNPSGLTFKFNEILNQGTYVDVDIDITLTHPFAGFPEFNGYDVRGVFMGNGSGTLLHNGLSHPVPGIDQMIIPDPDNGKGGPDGYTRWFNFSEFSLGGMPLFQYTKGNASSPGYDPSSILNPYRYFSLGLQPTEDLFTWLANNSSLNGVFPHGAGISRNYYLRFPKPDPGLKFSYAVIADWGGIKPEDHPSNAAEAVACTVVDDSTLFYQSSVDNGGSINLDISLFNWDSQPSNIYIESDVLSGVHKLSGTEMEGTGSGDFYSTYHVEIPADNLLTSAGNEYWIIAEYPDNNYANDFGVLNLAENDPLTAYFRYDHKVSPQNLPPVCIMQKATLAETGCGVVIVFHAFDSYDPEGEELTFEWDFDADGIFGEVDDDSYTGPPDFPSHVYYEDFFDNVCVRVSDPAGNTSECCDILQVGLLTHSKNIDVTIPGTRAVDIAMESDEADIYVLYDNGILRRYDLPHCYVDFFTYSVEPDCEWIDVSPNGSFIIGARDQAIVNKWNEWNYDNSGIEISSNTISFGQEGSFITPKDVFAMGQNGSLKNDHGWLHYGESVDTYTTAVQASGESGGYIYSEGNRWNWLDFAPAYENPGVENLSGDWIVAAESDQLGDFLWIVEREDVVAARFLIDTQLGGDVAVLTYAGQHFGESQVPTDSNDGLNDPSDITRDYHNNIYVLDHLSTGEYTIKSFKYDDDSVTALGSFGSSSDWLLTPRRIEGNDFNGYVVMLHTEGEQAMLSVFTENETPGL
ncbi:MAG TPA: hypothetical protein VGB30_00175 [bacterium]|jgi:hypothetical protein